MGKAMAYYSLIITKEDYRLIAVYEPQFNFEDVCLNIKEGKLIKRTFYVNSNNLLDINEDEGSVVFEIAKANSGFYHLNKDVFGIQHNIYIEQELDITYRWFVTYPNSSIMKRIDELIDEDLYIVKEEIPGKSCLPVSVFMELINVFPNSYEVRKYVSSRISYLLSNYTEGV